MDTIKGISTLYDFARFFESDVAELAKVRERLESVNGAIFGPTLHPVQSEGDEPSQDTILARLNEARNSFLNEMKELTNEVARLENVSIERQEAGNVRKADSVGVRL